MAIKIVLTGEDAMDWMALAKIGDIEPLVVEAGS